MTNIDESEKVNAEGGVNIDMTSSSDIKQNKIDGSGDTSNAVLCDEDSEAFPTLPKDETKNKIEKTASLSEQDVFDDNLEDDGFESIAVGEEEELAEFHYVEPKNPFANGLPSWTLEPPNTPILRKR